MVFQIGKSIVKGLLILANVFVAVLFIATLLATSISPERNIYLSYLPLVFPVIIFLNVLFALFWMLFRKWWFLLSLLVLVFWYPSVRSALPVNFSAQKELSSDNDIKIVTYNTMMNGFMKKHNHKSVNETIQYLADADADILLIQEFCVSKKDEYLQLDQINKALSAYPYRHIWFKHESASMKMGVATYSKFPIVRKKLIDFESSSNLSIYSDVIIRGDTVRVINNHLESHRLTEQDKKMLPAQLKDNFDTNNLSEATLYLSRKLGNAFRIRGAQADAVAEAVDSSPYPLIVCGDFNDVPGSYVYSKIKGEKLKDAFVRKGNGPGWTYHHTFFLFRIDYVLYDTSFDVVKYQRGDEKFSDHYPVVCHLRFKDQK